VYVSVTHEDYFSVTDFRLIEVLTIPDTGSNSRYDRFYFLISKYLVYSCFLHVQYLSFQREYSLETSVSSLLCRSTSGVTLDKVDFTLSRIGNRTVSQFSRKTSDIQSILSSRQVTCFSCSHSRLCRRDTFLQYLLCNGWILFQVVTQL